MLEEKTIMTQDDAYLFGQGTHYEIYNKNKGSNHQW